MSILITITVSIILIHCSELKLQHTDKPKIVFRFQEKYGTDFTVERYQPLDIVLDNFFAQYAWCLKFNYTGPDNLFIQHITFEGRSDSVMGVPNVTDNMISKWWCVVLQQHHDGKPYSYRGRNYTAQNIVFSLRSNLKSTFDMNLIYIISGTGLTAILIAVLLILAKTCCWQSNTPLQVPINPDSVFYLNLEIFRQQYERELAAQEEPEYEEID